MDIRYTLGGTPHPQESKPPRIEYGALHKKRKKQKIENVK